MQTADADEAARWLASLELRNELEECVRVERQRVDLEMERKTSMESRWGVTWGWRVGDRSMQPSFFTLDKLRKLVTLSIVEADPQVALAEIRHQNLARCLAKVHEASGAASRRHRASC